MRARSALSWDLTNALTAALLCAPSATLGCGGSVEARIDDDPDFVPLACEDEQPDWLAGVSPATPVDFAELRSSALTGVESTLSSTGTACSGANDLTACETALAALQPEQGFTFGSFVDHSTTADLRFTRGDEVGLVDTAAELVAYLAPIDTAGDAMLVAMANNFNLACGQGGALAGDDGFRVQAITYFGCGGRRRHVLSVSPEGVVESEESTVIKEATPNCVVGRRPAGLVARVGGSGPCAVGRYLARAAHLEAASVPAFEKLLVELDRHGAPASLRRGAARAIADEVRHARLVTRLARRYGGVPRRPAVRTEPVRDLEAIAIENAVEGCVRETLGAVVGAFQARRAEDPAVRRAYQGIALDEARHARLAWQLARWIEPQLSRGARERVRHSRLDAIRNVRAEVETEPTPSVHRALGVPNRRQSLAMVTELERGLWARAERLA